MLPVLIKELKSEKNNAVENSAGLVRSNTPRYLLNGNQSIALGAAYAGAGFIPAIL